MSKNPIIQTIVGALLLLAVLACLVVLALKDIVTGGQVMGVIGIIVGGALALLGTHIGATSTANSLGAMEARRAEAMALYSRGVIEPPEEHKTTTRSHS